MQNVCYSVFLQILLFSCKALLHLQDPCTDLALLATAERFLIRWGKPCKMHACKKVDISIANSAGTCTCMSLLIIIIQVRQVQIHHPPLTVEVDMDTSPWPVCVIATLTVQMELMRIWKFVEVSSISSWWTDTHTQLKHARNRNDF